MKTLLMLVALLPSLAFANVSVPRSKQYLWTVYDTQVSVGAGSAGAHPLGVFMPAGAVITDEYLYINTQFAAAGSESLSFQCKGTSDLMDLNGVKGITADQVLQAHLGATLPGVGGATGYIGQAASGNAVSLNGNYGSTPTACEVNAFVTNGPYTAGKATLITEFFIK